MEAMSIVLVAGVGDLSAHWLRTVGGDIGGKHLRPASRYLKPPTYCVFLRKYLESIDPFIYI